MSRPAWLDDKTRAAEEAKMLLESDIFIHSIARVAERLAGEWMRTEDPIEREQLWQRQKAVADVRHELQIIVGEGVAFNAELYDPRLAEGDE